MQTQIVKVGSVGGYYARPDDRALGGLIVIHEVWGLNAHTKDVAERFAREGYAALAPDLLSGTAADGGLDPAIMARVMDPDTDPAVRDEAQKELRAQFAPLQSPEFARATTSKLRQCFDWLAAQPETGGRVAVVGYCFGGSYAFALAMAEPKLVAAVPYYGHVEADTAKLKSITCPVLAFYGADDHNLMEQLPELDAAMKSAGVEFEAKVYPDTGHAFFNDTNPRLYRPEPAADAWRRTLEFLAEQFGHDAARK